MSELSNKTIGEGLCLEGIQVEKMEREIAALKEKIRTNKPICPHCLTELVASTHAGYYDRFDYWGCNCEKLPVNKENVFAGSYA